MTFPAGWELIVILFIILLLFGGRKLPDLARSIGQSMTEFRKGTREVDEDERASSDLDPDRSDRDRDPERDKER
jgi:sec-independent protein translocase protein TatA